MAFGVVKRGRQHVSDCGVDDFVKIAEQIGPVRQDRVVDVRHET